MVFNWGFLSSGWKSPNINDLKVELTKEYVNLFGTDLDLSPASPHNLLINYTCLTYRKLTGLVNDLYANTSIVYAGGEYLDRLGMNRSLERIQGSYATGRATFYLKDGISPTSVSYSIPSGTIIKTHSSSQDEFIVTNGGTINQSDLGGVIQETTSISKDDYIQSGRFKKQTVNYIYDIDSVKVGDNYVLNLKTELDEYVIQSGDITAGNVNEVTVPVYLNNLPYTNVVGVRLCKINTDYNFNYTATVIDNGDDTISIKLNFTKNAPKIGDTIQLTTYYDNYIMYYDSTGQYNERYCEFSIKDAASVSIDTENWDTPVTITYKARSITLPIRSVDIGFDKNVSAGVITVLTNGDVTMFGCVNEEATTGGRDTEPDDVFRTRIKNAHKGLGSATQNALEYKLQSLAGVEDAVIISPNTIPHIVQFDGLSTISEDTITDEYTVTGLETDETIKTRLSKPIVTSSGGAYSVVDTDASTTLTVSNAVTSVADPTLVTITFASGTTLTQGHNLSITYTYYTDPYYSIITSDENNVLDHTDGEHKITASELVSGAGNEHKLTLTLSHSVSTTANDKITSVTQGVTSHDISSVSVDSENANKVTITFDTYTPSEDDIIDIKYPYILDVTHTVEHVKYAYNVTSVTDSAVAYSTSLNCSFVDIGNGDDNDTKFSLARYVNGVNVFFTNMSAFTYTIAELGTFKTYVTTSADNYDNVYKLIEDNRPIGVKSLGYMSGDVNAHADPKYPFSAFYSPVSYLLDYDMSIMWTDSTLTNADKARIQEQITESIQIYMQNVKFNTVVYQDKLRIIASDILVDYAEKCIITRWRFSPANSDDHGSDEDNDYYLIDVGERVTTVKASYTDM